MKETTVIKKCHGRMDGRTDERTDPPTETARCVVALVGDEQAFLQTLLRDTVTKGSQIIHQEKVME